MYDTYVFPKQLDLDTIRWYAQLNYRIHRQMLPIYSNSKIYRSESRSEYLNTILRVSTYLLLICSLV